MTFPFVMEWQLGSPQINHMKIVGHADARFMRVNQRNEKNFCWGRQESNQMELNWQIDCNL